VLAKLSLLEISGVGNETGREDFEVAFDMEYLPEQNHAGGSFDNTPNGIRK